MLNQLLETCLSKFEPLTLSALEHLEKQQQPGGAAETLAVICQYSTHLCRSVTETPHDTQDASAAFQRHQFAANLLCPGDLCMHAHSPQYQRRPPFDPHTGELIYLPIPCSRTQCQTGSKNTQSVSPDPRCPYAHTLTEVNYHPYCYRTVPCPQPKGKCKDPKCVHYHSKQQRRDMSLFLSVANAKATNVSYAQESSRTQSQHSEMLSFEKNALMMSGKTQLTISDIQQSQLYMSEKTTEKVEKSDFSEASFNPKVDQERSNLHKANSLGSSEHILTLNLNTFKTIKCQQIDKQGHNLKRCPDFHEKLKDRRRPPQQYTSELCSYIAKKKQCPQGEACIYCHTRVEEFYHPDKYKAKYCQSFLTQMECEYGEYCSFAHSEREVSVDLIEKFERDTDFYRFHYKTVWCPYTDQNHQKETCVYAHTWTDFRRKPYVYGYSSEICQNWEMMATKNITVYQSGCQAGLACPYSHGWFESQYHHERYKTEPCTYTEDSCDCNFEHCPYYHDGRKDRIFDQPLTFSDCFLKMPRTRVLSFQTAYYEKQRSRSLSHISAYNETLWQNRLPHSKINKKDLAASQISQSSDSQMLSICAKSFQPTHPYSANKLRKTVSSSGSHQSAQNPASSPYPQKTKKKLNETSSSGNKRLTFATQSSRRSDQQPSSSSQKTRRRVTSHDARDGQKEYDSSQTIQEVLPTNKEEDSGRKTVIQGVNTQQLLRQSLTSSDYQIDYALVENTSDHFGLPANDPGKQNDLVQFLQSIDYGYLAGVLMKHGYTNVHDMAERATLEELQLLVGVDAFDLHQELQKYLQLENSVNALIDF